jgi:DNA invertase Pin-like site-specific DNA recombinase
VQPAYSYIRWSSDPQEDGDSLRRQTTAIDRYLERHPEVKEMERLVDGGKSGFKGDEQEELKRFCGMVEAGRVPKGCLLIAENIDRLTRGNKIKAQLKLLGLIDDGVRIVILSPSEMVYDTEMGMGHQIMLGWEAFRANSESEAKSDRGGKAWEEKRRLGRDGKPQKATKVMGEGCHALTRKLPAWLKLEGGKPVEVPEKVAVVKRIWALARTTGARAIARKLNDEGTPTLSGRGSWGRSAVAKILQGRAVCGEYQPHTGRGKNRKPVGEPIKGYYPEVIKEPEWYAALKVRETREKGQPGRPPKRRVNLFAGLLKDTRTGGGVHTRYKGSAQLLVPAAAEDAGAKWVSFPAEVFEDCVLRRLHEIDPRKVLPEAEGADRVDALEGEKSALEARAAELTDLLADPSRAAKGVNAALLKLEARQKALEAELADARLEAATPLSGAWEDAKTLLTAMGDGREARVRLAAAIRKVVEGVWCLFVPRGRTRIAAVQVVFRGGAQRDYLIAHTPLLRGLGQEREAETLVSSLVLPDGVTFDLRNPEFAAHMETMPIPEPRKLTFRKVLGTFKRTEPC